MKRGVPKIMLGNTRVCSPLPLLVSARPAPSRPGPPHVPSPAPLAPLNYCLRPIVRPQNPFRSLEGLFSESDIARHELINREGAWLGTVQRDPRLKLTAKNLSDICFKYSFSNTSPCSRLHLPYKNAVPMCGWCICGHFSKTGLLLARGKPGSQREKPPQARSAPRAQPQQGQGKADVTAESVGPYGCVTTHFSP